MWFYIIVVDKILGGVKQYRTTSQLRALKYCKAKRALGFGASIVNTENLVR